MLSSWLRRLARVNHCTVEELGNHLRLDRRTLGDVAVRPSSGDLEKLAVAARLDISQVIVLLSPGFQDPRSVFVAPRPFQTCPVCTRLAGDEAFERRHWRFAWSLRCEECGTRLIPTWPHRHYETDDILSPRHERLALAGAARLRDAVGANDRRVLKRTFLLMDVLIICGNVAPSADAMLYGGRSIRLNLFVTLAHICSHPIAKAAWLLGPLTAPPWYRFDGAFPGQKQLLRRLRAVRGEIEERFANRLIRTEIIDLPGQGIETAYVSQRQLTLKQVSPFRQRRSNQPGGGRDS